MFEIMHIGVPTNIIQPNETYLSDLKVYITNPDDSAFKFEYLRFEEGSPLPMIMQQQNHVACKVDSITKYAEGAKIIVDPFPANENMTIAFIVKDGIVMELMEVK